MTQPITLSMEGTLLNWVKKVGDPVKAGDVVAEVESDKATVEIEAPSAGVLTEQSARPGDALQAGVVIGLIGAASEAAAAPSQPAAAAPAPVPGLKERTQTRKNGAPALAPTAPDDGRIKASPVARKMAEERGIDLQQVRGSGPGGRIVKEDIETYQPPAARPAPAVGAPSLASGVVTAAPWRKMPEGPDVEILDVSTLRKRVAAVTVESKQFTPHFYVTSEVDVEALLTMRQVLNQSLPENGVKITVNDLVVKAAALTLRQFPNLNSHYYGDHIARHKHINIGMAVALPQGGLMNVVARDADQVSVGTLAAHNKDMIARAREGKVKPEDITGATFTVSNLGTFDVEHFIAVINPPEAGILAVGTALKKPVVKPDGTLGTGTRMKVTISVDHRVSDGAEGAAFLQAFKTLLENPMRLLI